MTTNKMLVLQNIACTWCHDENFGPIQVYYRKTDNTIHCDLVIVLQNTETLIWEYKNINIYADRKISEELLSQVDRSFVAEELSCKNRPKDDIVID